MNLTHLRGAEMKITPIALAVSAALTLSLSSAIADDAALREMAKSAGLQALPYGTGQVTDNVLTREKITLGAMLFFDPRLSASGVISCNTCHNLGTGGDDNLTNLGGTRLAEGSAQLTHGAQCRLQQGPVLGWTRRGP